MSLSDISANFTEETLQYIIEKAGGVKYTSWEFAGGFKKGDSYLSEVYRVIVKGLNAKNEEISVSLVIKSTPKNVGRRKTFRSADFFRNEVNFYKYIVQAFADFQVVKRDVKNKFVEIADCLVAHSDGVNDFVAMNDLGQEGYKTESRNSGFDVNLCRLVMQTLGRFHAMSFVIRDQSPSTFQNISGYLEETYYASKLKWWYNNFIKKQIEVALDALEKEYGGTEIEEKGKKFLTDGDLYDKMVKLTHTRNRFSVLGHGDCWTPNFLFHYEEFDGKMIPVKAKMIDFQLARFASPALDISFFIYSCTSQELREKHYDHLLRSYHESLCSLIREFGSSPEFLFPFSALKKEMEDFACFGVGMGIESIPFSVMSDAEAPDLDTIIEDKPVPIETLWVLKPIENQEGRKRLADIFKHAVDMGYIN